MSLVIYCASVRKSRPGWRRPRQPHPQQRGHKGVGVHRPFAARLQARSAWCRRHEVQFGAASKAHLSSDTELMTPWVANTRLNTKPIPERRARTGMSPLATRRPPREKSCEEVLAGVLAQAVTRG